MNIDVSIVICTRNRKDSLVRTLESLRGLKISEGLTHEILIVDNGSSDGTREIVLEYVDRNPRVWKYHAEPKKGLSNARNCGVRRARGKVIAFTDDDVLVDENWIQALWQTFIDKPDVIAVQGRILLQKEIEQLPYWADTETPLFCTWYEPDFGPCYTDTLVGANMAFRREAFEKYGLFDPRLGAGASGFGEETEFCMRLKDAGEKIFYQPDILVFHEYVEKRLTWDEWRKRLEQRAHGSAIIDVLIKRKKVRALKNWKKLARYYAKFFLYFLLHNQRKRYKYRRRLLYLRNYMKSAVKLQKT